MRIEAFTEWLAREVGARHRAQGCASEAARAREEAARAAPRLIARARKEACEIPVHKTHTEDAALSAARRTVVATLSRWSMGMSAAAREIESALAGVLIEDDAGWATPEKREAMSAQLARIDPHWGQAQAWRPTLGRMRGLAQLDSEGWGALVRAPAWAARRAALSLEPDEIRAGMQAWSARWTGGEAGATHVLERWRWPDVEPPLEAVAAWAKAGRRPRSGAEWGASVEAQAHRRPATQIDIGAIARGARSTRARVFEAIRAAAHAIVEDMEGEPEEGLARREREHERMLRWATLHTGSPAPGPKRLRLVTAHVREGERWRRRLAWEVKLHDAATLIASARSTETRWEEYTTRAVRIDARFPAQMKIVEWVPHRRAPSHP